MRSWDINFLMILVCDSSQFMICKEVTKPLVEFFTRQRKIFQEEYFQKVMQGQRGRLTDRSLICLVEMLCTVLTVLS